MGVNRVRGVGAPAATAGPTGAGVLTPAPAAGRTTEATTVPVNSTPLSGTRPAPPSVHVEIGELVFDGFDAVDSDRVADAFRRELTRLVTERGVPLAAEGDRAVDLLGGLPPLPATSSPYRLGQALARAVHAGLTGHARPTGGRRRP